MCAHLIKQGSLYSFCLFVFRQGLALITTALQPVQQRETLSQKKKNLDLPVERALESG